ncbi:MAG: ABC transporter ATP-binding protein [Candidatus Rokuibacteriota bacterium]
MTPPGEGRGDGADGAAVRRGPPGTPLIAPLPGETRGPRETPLLETRGLTRRFGALAAVRDVDFRLEVGARHALIGPNGAGKTTFVNLLTGVLQPTSGQVRLRDRDITSVAEAERVKLGIARTFQINRLFRGLSVLENVYIAVAERMGAAPGVLRAAGRRRDVVDASMHLLETLRLTDDAGRPVRELPYGRQRLVELAIALGLEPEVLLLDEPAAGVPSAESHIILDALDNLPRHIAVLVIDHDMDLVFRFAERITVMVSGAIFAGGTPREIGANPDVRAVYLGQAARG